MERHEILEAMSELKLYGMRASFDEIAGKGLARRDELYPLIASLVRAERTHRQARSISYRIVGAKFPVLKDIDKFVFSDTPVDEGQVRELASGAFLDAKRNAIFIGGTGTGKTHLCIGGHSRPRQGTFLQSGRSRQSARTGESRRPQRAALREFAAL
jgi:DNA replication protein DnaC